MIVALRNDKGRKLISCREAAEAYGCTMSYIRRLARLGRLQTEEVGGCYFFEEADVKRLAAQAAKGEGRQRKRAEGFQAG
jgi:excisionase family DNA binding protein